MANEPATTGVYRCKTCKKDKPALAFAACRNNASGIQHECRECTNKRVEKRNDEVGHQRAVKRATHYAFFHKKKKEAQ